MRAVAAGRWRGLAEMLVVAVALWRWLGGTRVVAVVRMRRRLRPSSRAPSAAAVAACRCGTLGGKGY